MWGWGPDWGWVGVLIGVAFWIGIIVVAVILLKGDVPDLSNRFRGSPALRLLEERYALGEISREEFLERRSVLSEPSPPAGSEPTEPQPPAPSA